MNNLKELLKSEGALAPFKIHKTEVEFKGVGKVDVWVKELPDTLLDSILTGNLGAVEKQQRLVRAGICNESGGALFTDKEVEVLRRKFRLPLADAVIKINIPNEAAQEENSGNSDSEDQSGSGTSSPSASDEPSAS